MTEGTILKIIEDSKIRDISEKELCIELNINPKLLYYYKKKFNIKTTTRGKNFNSRKKREFTVNDKYFNELSLESCYWAGFIAADGNISKDFKKLSIGLSSKDINHLQIFLNTLNSNYNISTFLVGGKFETCSIAITSSEICYTLFNNFNITPKKSLTLLPPFLYNEDLIDSFIIGYIDGDGSIGIHNRNNKKFLRISVIGTFEICTFIKERFSKIYGKDIGTITKNKKHSKNTFSYSVTDRSARVIFNYLCKFNVPKLNRKWGVEKVEYCINFKKNKKINSRYMEILNLKSNGLTQAQIAKTLNVTQANISWYYKQELFKKMEMETKLLDKGESNIEDEN